MTKKTPTVRITTHSNDPVDTDKVPVRIDVNYDHKISQEKEEKITKELADLANRIDEILRCDQ